MTSVRVRAHPRRGSMGVRAHVRSRLRQYEPAAVEAAELLREEVEADEAECPMCGGPGVSLGQLGRLHHYRCRNCGVGFSHETSLPRSRLVSVSGPKGSRMEKGV